MKTVHPGILYTPLHGGVVGGISPSAGSRGKHAPEGNFFFVNVYCNFIVNLNRSL
jgi:hypothetical protein